MGTRSVTIVMGGNEELVRIYRQYDGYPDGHGVDLAKLCDVQIVNGIPGGDRKAKIANGMGCLAAQIIKGLKEEAGNIYIEACNKEVGDWVEYVYYVRGSEGQPPRIDCGTHTAKEPAWPFNLQTDDKYVFSGTAKEWLKKYKPKKGKAA